ncbi:MAG: hypothetical protein WBF04_08345 [Candidatus Sulfotelmatobacter sp.]
MSIEEAQTDAEIDKELCDHATFMVEMLQDEISMLLSFAEEHDTECSQRYPLLMEIHALEGAKRYFAEKVLSYTEAGPTSTKAAADELLQ